MRRHELRCAKLAGAEGSGDFAGGYRKLAACG